MLTTRSCLSCFAKQILTSVDAMLPEGAARDAAVSDCLHILADCDQMQAPPATAQLIHRRLRAICGGDPYAEVKRDATAMALDILPQLRERLSEAEDPFELAIRLAAAGNLIDVGAMQDIGRASVDRALEDCLHCPLDAAQIRSFRERAAAAEHILYLADNAGELVFDRLLLEQLPLDRLVLVVRGEVVLNDVTRPDVAASGIDGITVIDNGSDAPGTILDDCSAAFQEMFNKSDLIISKGQGNYESLAGVQAPIFFILKAKCQPVADLIGVELGSIVARFV